MPKAFPLEFRRDVVAVARRREAPLSRIAKDFGISEACLHHWLKMADVEDGLRPGITKQEADEMRALKKRNHLLEQENEVLRRAAVYLGRMTRCVSSSRNCTTRRFFTRTTSPTPSSARPTATRRREVG